MAWIRAGAQVGGVNRLICTCLLYLASVVGAIVFYRAVRGQPVEGIGSFLVLVAGPIIAVVLYRRPPRILVPMVFVPYYVVVALSIASEYDESRWSYSRLEAGAPFYLALQLVAAWAAITTCRSREVSGWL